MGIPTPHIEVKDPSLIAKTVLMPGDPIRARIFAERFLDNPVLINGVRNMFAYTGTYKGKKVTVFASGMGQPSIGIYSYELYKFYGVENIIRIGSAGSYSEDLEVYDTVLVKAAFSESNYAKVAFDIKGHKLKSDAELNKKLKKAAKKLGIPLKEVATHSSDVFYHEGSFDWKECRDKNGVSCVEMESFALFANAQALGKKASCLLTISDSFVSDVATTSVERQSKFINMMKVALEADLYDKI